MFAIFWNNVLALGFLGGRKWHSPRDATLASYMQRYSLSTPTTQNHGWFLLKCWILPVSPLSRRRRNQFELYDDIIDLFSSSIRFPCHSCPNFDFVWIMRVISTHLPDEKKEKGKDKIYRVGGENRGDALKGLEMGRCRVSWQRI